MYFRIIFINILGFEYQDTIKETNVQKEFNVIFYMYIKIPEDYIQMQIETSKINVQVLNFCESQIIKYVLY